MFKRSKRAIPAPLSDRERRDRLASFVYSKLGDAAFRQHLSVLAEGGSRPIVTALDEELLSEVMQRVIRSGGAANTFVAMNSGLVELVMIENAAVPTGQTGVIDLGPDPIHEDITIGMLVDVARNFPKGVSAPVRLPHHRGRISSDPGFVLAH